MNVSVSNVEGVPATPASVMGRDLMENVYSIMALNGIEAISLHRYSCGLGHKTHVIISHFPDAPAEIVNQGIVIKDAIAQMLAISNIWRVVITLTDEDNAVREYWAKSVEAVRTSAAGSGQDASAAANGAKRLGASEPTKDADDGMIEVIA